jgi:hypothetical protein
MCKSDLEHEMEEELPVPPISHEQVMAELEFLGPDHEVPGAGVAMFAEVKAARTEDDIIAAAKRFNEASARDRKRIQLGSWKLMYRNLRLRGYPSS